jgi:hypothetical protein
MKTHLKYFLIITLFFFISCDNDKNADPELVSSWKLIENLADPGGGSGTFQTVESEKVINFYNDGTVSSNGSLCDMSINSDNPTSGTYSSSELTFSSSDCNNTEHEYSYEINGSFLIVNYPCFEPCRSKYSLIE